MRQVSWLLGVLGSVALIAWMAAIGLLYANQRRLIYLPDPQRVAPDVAGLKGVREETIETPDGARLIAWWSPPKPDKPVILYFHGNGGNLAGRAGRMQLFQRAGFGGLMLAYRSYSGSSGHPSETALVADAGLAYDWIAARGIAGDRVIVFGESLGTGVAVKLSAARPVRALILDSPFTSLVDVAAGRMPWVPVRLLMWDRFDSLETIARVKAPLLVIHGDRDDVVPYALGVRLFDAANQPKQMLTVKGGDHVTPLAEGPWTTVRAFIEGLEPPK